MLNPKERFEGILFDTTKSVEQIEKPSKQQHVTELRVNGVVSAIRTVTGNGTTYQFSESTTVYVNGIETPAVSADLTVIVVRAKRGFDVYELLGNRKTNHITRLTHRLIGHHMKIENVNFLLEERGVQMTSAQLNQLKSF